MLFTTRAAHRPRSREPLFSGLLVRQAQMQLTHAIATLRIKEALLTSIMFFRIVGWALIIAIVVMTVVPPSLRVVTGAPHIVEHALIFSAAGIAVRLGYELRLSVGCAAAVVSCAALELVQLAIPGRHARVSDFVVDAAAASTGLGIGWTMHRFTNGYRLREGGVWLTEQR